MKVIFLGTNGWYDTKTGNTSCVFIEANKYYIILDAGNGFYKLGQYVKSNKPIYVFLSHFHLDHIVGLHILNKFNFKQELCIYGQKGTKRILTNLIKKPFTASFKKLPFKTKIYDLNDGVHHVPFYIEYQWLFHSSPCLGYRFRIENKIITYCTDTGFCPNAIELAKDADLLITECSYKTDQGDSNWPHLNPVSASQIAKEAKVKMLALTHFDAGIYLRLKERIAAQQIAQRIFKNTIYARDGMKVTV